MLAIGNAAAKTQGQVGSPGVGHHLLPRAEPLSAASSRLRRTNLARTTCQYGKV
jgi:hypothetical protein